MTTNRGLSVRGEKGVVLAAPAKTRGKLGEGVLPHQRTILTERVIDREKGGSGLHCNASRQVVAEDRPELHASFLSVDYMVQANCWLLVWPLLRAVRDSVGVADGQVSYATEFDPCHGSSCYQATCSFLT